MRDSTFAFEEDERRARLRADLERHWVTRALTRWLRIPSVARAVSVTALVTFALGVFVGDSLLSRRIRPRVLAATGCPVAGANVPGGSDPLGGCFPGPGNVGVPSGTSLTTYSGGTTISTTVTIDAKTVNSRLSVVSGGALTVTRSQLMIGVDVSGTGTLSVSDSYATTNSNANKVIDAEGAGLTMLRNNIDGGQGNSGGWCVTNCTLTDNWIHNETVLDPASSAHMSGWRMRQFGTFTHNTFECNVAVTPADGGCSANFTGYGDFETVQNNTMDKNLWTWHRGSAYCAYGGSTAGKPFPNAHDIRFTNNVFQKGTGWGGSEGPCADFGTISDYNAGASGNSFTNNKYDDGTTVVP